MQSTPSMAWPLVSPELQRALDGTKEGVVLEALGLGNHPLSPPPISPHISPYLPICFSTRPARSVTDLHCAHSCAFTHLRERSGVAGPVRPQRRPRNDPEEEGCVRGTPRSHVNGLPRQAVDHET